MRGALTWPKEGILINEMHNRQAPILRAVPYLDGDEVKIDTPVPNTTRGRDAVTNIREGVWTGLSVEFHSRSEGRRGNRCGRSGKRTSALRPWWTLEPIAALRWKSGQRPG